MAEKESTLYHVYAEQKTWPGNLNLIIDELNCDFDNRLIYDEDNFAIRRMNCQQKCKSFGSCHYCVEQFQFPKTLKLYKQYKDSI